MRLRRQRSRGGRTVPQNFQMFAWDRRSRLIGFPDFPGVPFRADPDYPDSRIFRQQALTCSSNAGPRRKLRRGPASRVGGKLAIASSAQPRRENHAAEFSSVRVGPPFSIKWIPGFCGPDYPDSRIFQACRPLPIQIIRFPDYPISSKKYNGSRSGDIA